MRNATEELTRYETDYIAHSNEIFKIFIFLAIGLTWMYRVITTYQVVV